MPATAIIPAGGAGHRMGLNIPKQFHLLTGHPILVRTLQAFHKVKEITDIIVVVPENHIASTQAIMKEYNLNRVSALVPGGTLRQDSVKAGLSGSSECGFFNFLSGFFSLSLILRFILLMRIMTFLKIVIRQTLLVFCQPEL